MRIMLLTARSHLRAAFSGNTRTSLVEGRGSAAMSESSFLQQWPKYLDMERSAAKPTLTRPGFAAMVKAQQTLAWNAMPSRSLSESEVAVIRACHAEADIALPT